MWELKPCAPASYAGGGTSHRQGWIYRTTRADHKPIDRAWVCEVKTLMRDIFFRYRKDKVLVCSTICD